ncbi:hypothetical protein ABPG75_007788 [Micractinium tetrahymenae]
MAAATTVPRVVVIGSGLAGCAAALTAARVLPRAQVVVLEKEAALGGNTAKANSGINALSPGQGDSAATFKEDTLRSGGGRCQSELVELLVDRSRDALQFLEAAGARFGSVSQLGGQSVARTHSPPAGEPAVGLEIMRALHRSMQQQDNIQVQTGVKVTALAPAASGAWCIRTLRQQEQQEQRAQEQEQEAHAVVLATGGFAASQALLRRYAPQAAGLGTTNGAFAEGEGLELGQQAGAALVDVDQVQLNPTGIVDPSDPHCPTKTVAPEKLRGLGAILLSARARRFVNELGRRDEVAGAILGQPSKQAVLLFGAATADAFGLALESYLSSGLIQKAETLAQLADQAGLPAEAVREELEAYSQAAAAGRDGFGKTAFPARIDAGQPLYWTRVTPVAHYCMGGLAINASARVLDSGRRPIPGLFAAGEVAGGIHGKNLLVGNSLLDCVVFGRIAGASAAQHAAEFTAGS